MEARLRSHHPPPLHVGVMVRPALNQMRVTEREERLVDLEERELAPDPRPKLATPVEQQAGDEQARCPVAIELCTLVHREPPSWHGADRMPQRAPQHTVTLLHLISSDG